METVGETGTTRALERGAGHTTVFLLLDGSRTSAAAMPVAHALAQASGVALHVVHAGDRPEPPLELLQKLGLSGRALGHVVVDELIGEPIAAILEHVGATPGAVIVQTVCGEKRAATGRAGHVTRAVLSAAPCPVILVRPGTVASGWSMRRVLLPHDGSAQTAAALTPAVELAQRAQAELLVLHVATLAGEPGLPVPCYLDQPQHEWPEWSREFMERMDLFCLLPQQLRPRLFLSHGDPGAEILRFAAERRVDLIGLGWSGALVGTHGEVVKELLDRAPCPVLFSRIEHGLASAAKGTQVLPSWR